MAKLRPLGTKIVVKREDASDRSKGGIVLPDSAKERPRIGVVSAVGSRCEVELNEGDRVVFSAYSGVEIKVDGHEFLILDESEVLSEIQS